MVQKHNGYHASILSRMDNLDKQELKESSLYPTVKHILNISSLDKYITSVQRCPAIKQNLTLQWNNAQTRIIYYLNNTILQETRNPTHQYNTQSQINKTQKQDNISNPSDDDTHMTTNTNYDGTNNPFHALTETHYDRTKNPPNPPINQLMNLPKKSSLYSHVRIYIVCQHG